MLYTSNRDTYYNRNKWKAKTLCLAPNWCYLLLLVAAFFAYLKFSSFKTEVMAYGCIK